MTTILYNPKSQNGAAEGIVTAWAESHGYADAEKKSVIDTDIAAFVASQTEDDKIILCGGDGTLMRFADAIRDIELKVPVFFTPAGTGNDFLRDVPNDTDPVLVNKYIVDLPRVYVNGEEHVFVNGIGYGIGGYCCEVGDALQAKSDKPVNYTSIAIKGLLGQFSPCKAEVTVDGVTRTYNRVWEAATMNGRCYGGGLLIAPNQDRLNPEGTVSCVTIHRFWRIRTLFVFSTIGKGTHLKFKKAIDLREGHEITVKFDTPCALQIDGETYLGVTEYTVRSRKKVKELQAAAKAAAQAETKTEEPATV